MNEPKIPCVDRSQVSAFRLSQHNLTARLPIGSLLAAAGACGVQNTPPGSAGLSLYARVAELTPQAVERALYEEKSLLQVWSLRSAPLIFPTADRAVFTLGLLPLDDAAISDFTGGVDQALEKIGLQGGEAEQYCAEALLETLDGRALTKDELGVALAARIDRRLDETQRAVWHAPSWYAAGQSLGESVVRFMLPVVALQGLCCHAERVGNKAYIRRVDQWVRADLTPSRLPSCPFPGREGVPSEETGVSTFRGGRSSLNQSRAELLRRYLRCYGPSSVQHFAEWAGIGRVQAEEAWKFVQGELAEVRFGKKPGWVLAEDLVNLTAPPEPAGIRFLPPHDPYLQLRDRENLVADAALRRAVWRSTGNPGVVLVNGQFAGTWRPKKQGRRLKVNIQWVLGAQQFIHSHVEAEANGLGAMLAYTLVEVQSSSHADG